MTIFTQEIKMQWLLKKLDVDPADFLELKPPQNKADWIAFMQKHPKNFLGYYSSNTAFTMRRPNGGTITHPLFMVDKFPPDFTDEFTLLDYTLANWRGCYRVDDDGKPIQPSDTRWALALDMVDFYKRETAKVGEG